MSLNFVFQLLFLLAVTLFFGQAPTQDVHSSYRQRQILITHITQTQTQFSLPLTLGYQIIIIQDCQLVSILPCLFLPPASEGWEKVIFSLCASVHTSTRGCPILPQGVCTPSHVWTGGGYPIPSRGGGTLPPYPRRGLDGVHPVHNWTGYPPTPLGERAA